MPSNVCNEIIYPFPNFSGFTVSFRDISPAIHDNRRRYSQQSALDIIFI